MLITIFYDIPPYTHIYTQPLGKDLKCVQKYLRGDMNENAPYRFDWEKMRANPDCQHSTLFGPVANWDGEIIVDNPKFVKKGFSFNNTEVVKDDLM